MRLTSEEFSILEQYYQNAIDMKVARLDRVKHDHNGLYDDDLIDEQVNRIDNEITRLENRIKELKGFTTEL